MELSREGPVTVVRMRDDDNRIHDRWLAEMVAALDAAEGAEGPGALVVTGHGKFFSNGLDLDGLLSHTPDEARRFLSGLFSLWARVLTFPMVTVAAVNGHAFAAGAMFSLTFDVRVQRADRGWWCVNEAEMGVQLQPAMHAVLAAKLSPPVLHEAVALATRYGGEAAVDAGIASEAVPEDQVISRAVEIAASHADKRGTAQSRLKAGQHASSLAILTDPGAIAFGE